MLALGGNCWASVNNFRVWSRPALYEKRCEITVVVIWRYINKIELDMIHVPQKLYACR